MEVTHPDNIYKLSFTGVQRSNPDVSTSYVMKV
jgi:hypothetical protein